MAAMVLLASVLAGFSGVSYVGSASGPLSNRFGYASPADPESISPAYLLVEVTWRRNITNSSGGYNPELILVFAHPDTSWSNNSEYSKYRIEVQQGS